MGLPLLLMFLTHTRIFILCYPWVLLIFAVVGAVIAFACSVLIHFVTASIQIRGTRGREAQVVLLVAALFAAVFMQMSVSVMTRVYAGEWQHGGYLNRIFQHLLSDSGSPNSCPNSSNSLQL